MSEERLDRAVARGTAVNVLGVVAKALHPLFFIAITRVYGPAVFGVYLIAHTLIEMAISFTFSGVQDGMLLFAARHVHDEGERPRVYRVMASALLIVLALTGLAVTLAFLAGPGLVAARYADKPGLAEALQWMAIALPFLAFPQIVVASTKALMIMKYDVLLLGTLRPAALLAAALVAYTVDDTVTGLALAYLVSNLVVSLVAVVVLARHFSLRDLGAQLLRPRLDWPLLRFAIPQNLNLTLVYFMSGISVLFLGATAVPEATIAFYGTAAEILRQMKQARLAFSQAFTPVIARLHGAGRLEELDAHYNAVTRWITTLTAPVLLAVFAFKGPLLLLFHETYTWDSGFMSLLAVGVFLACAFGLSGNIIAMTGRSGLNLLDSVITAATSFGLNWYLIPRHGLWGAAGATAGATLLSVTIKTVQIWFLYRIRLRVGPVFKPFLAGACGAGSLALVALVGPVGLAGSALQAAAGVGVFLLVMRLLGLHPQDREVFLGLLRRRRSP